MRWIPLLFILFGTCSCTDETDRSRLQASGHVEATEVRISTKHGGTLISLEAGEGDEVRSGQVLAHFDTTDAELQLRAARAERASSDANLRLLLAGAREEEIAMAAAQLSKARADLSSSERDLKRMKDLLSSGSGTEKARDDAGLRQEVAARSVESARENLAKLRAGARREELDFARARLEAAEARIAQIEQESEDAVIVSPLSGVVTEKLAEEGEILAPRTALLVITDLEHPWLNIYVGNRELPSIRIGQPVEVVTDAGPKRYPGRITYIASEAEFTPKNVQTRDERMKLVYKVKVGLENSERIFKPGMPAEAIFDLKPPS